MRYVIAVLTLVALAGCSTVQAEKGGKQYTCVPNDAMDRGPFKPTPAPGTALVVKNTEGPTLATK